MVTSPFLASRSESFHPDFYVKDSRIPVAFQGDRSAPVVYTRFPVRFSTLGGAAPSKDNDGIIGQAFGRRRLAASRRTEEDNII